MSTKWEAILDKARESYDIKKEHQKGGGELWYCVKKDGTAGIGWSPLEEVVEYLRKEL